MEKTEPIWIDGQGTMHALSEMGTDHIVNLLNIIERGGLKNRLNRRTVTLAELRREARKRGAVVHTPNEWSVA